MEGSGQKGEWHWAYMDNHIDIVKRTGQHMETLAIEGPTLPKRRRMEEVQDEEDGEDTQQVEEERCSMESDV